MINAWGITDDDLLLNVSSYFRNKTKKFRNVTWPPHPKYLDNPPDMLEELLKLLVISNPEELRMYYEQPTDCRTSRPLFRVYCK